MEIASLVQILFLKIVIILFFFINSVMTNTYTIGNTYTNGYYLGGDCINIGYSGTITNGYPYPYFVSTSCVIPDTMTIQPKEKKSIKPQKPQQSKWIQHKKQKHTGCPVEDCTLVLLQELFRNEVTPPDDDWDFI
jgi:hypothetical protein